MQITETRMYKALIEKDPSFEGVFIFGVKTTGIFCRPSCSARKPKRENVDFFKTTKEALARGYRPCKVCHPMLPKGEFPNWIKLIIAKINQDPTLRFNDSSIRKLGVDPNRVRRWFKKNHQMTFQAYLRALRLGRSFGHLTDGGKVIDTAFEHGYDSLSGFTDAFKKLTGSAPSQVSNKHIISVYQILTPLGPMIAASVKEGICLLEFTDHRGLENELKDLQKRLEAPLVTSKGPHIKQLQSELNEYFEGKRTSFDVPLVTPGSEFQNKVWNILKKIPYGKTRSYKDQALAIENPKALRAVARANGENRIAIVIPCHRVIGSDGKLVGYSGGLPRKKFLLDLEKRNL